jgi:hypothetical protein
VGEYFAGGLAAVTLKEEIERAVRAREKMVERGDYTGDDWYRLTAAEGQVFGIDRGRWPRMVTAWELYEDLIDIVDPPHFDARLIEAERRKWQKLRLGVTDVRVFMDIAVAAARLTEKEAHAMFYKVEFWNVRRGHMFGGKKR